jgi:hypothetical protein
MCLTHTKAGLDDVETCKLGRKQPTNGPKQLANEEQAIKGEMESQNTELAHLGMTELPMRDVITSDSLGTSASSQMCARSMPNAVESQRIDREQSENASQQSASDAHGNRDRIESIIAKLMHLSMTGSPNDDPNVADDSTSTAHTQTCPGID